MASTQTIHEFQDLGNNIYLWEPPPPAAPKNPGYVHISPAAPSLIILCTWLGGSTANRVDKYTSGYRTSFPNTPILLLRTVLTDISARTFRRIRTRLALARDVIKRLTAVNSHGATYLHIFSHGGCNTALQLAISMRETRLYFPVARIVFDCCPGDATYRKAYDAAALSLPGLQPANAIGKILLHIPIAAITVAQTVGLMNSVRELRLQLNDSQIFGSEALRMYLYSKADRMVDFADVQLHMADARKLGYKVESVMFATSAHCSLPREDAARYWLAIKTFWNSGEVSTKTRSLKIDEAATSGQSKL
jgi:hypothetical protein